ncbi:hypothetical protein BJ980_002909 [Nocardioides daedukensis]|uniref:Uncharacterized protein n=1 Tax=Nocardioides daedukensis TaxID=634462 RepID=A0A7Y9S2B0_9ACTN|nr:hypothetical protein [Nocardioides daedukensis]
MGGVLLTLAVRRLARALRGEVLALLLLLTL